MQKHVKWEFCPIVHFMRTMKAQKTTRIQVWPIRIQKIATLSIECRLTTVVFVFSVIAIITIVTFILERDACSVVTRELMIWITICEKKKIEMWTRIPLKPDRSKFRRRFFDSIPAKFSFSSKCNPMTLNIPQSCLEFLANTWQMPINFPIGRCSWKTRWNLILFGEVILTKQLGFKMQFVGD